MKAWITNHSLKKLYQQGKADCSIKLAPLDDDVARVEIEIPDPQPSLLEKAKEIHVRLKSLCLNSLADDLQAAIEAEEANNA